jgi:formate hydrogenlyase transcriptional activator
MKKDHMTKNQLLAENEDLRRRLEEAEETLQAIHRGEVDALVLSGPDGDQVFTLEGAETPYRILLETMKEGAVTMTADGNIMYCNNRFAEMIKMSPPQIINSPIYDVISPADKKLFDGILTERGRGEISLRAKDKTHLPVYLSCTSLELGDTPSVCMVVTDLTEQKRNEEILKADRLSRSILDQATEAIIVCNENGQITRASQLAHELYGKNLLRRHFDDIFSLGVSREGTIESRFSIATPLKGEFVLSAGVSFRRDDGKVFDLLLSARPLLDQQKLIQGCVVTLVDITETKRMHDLVRMRMHLTEYASAHTLEEVLRKTLDKMGSLVNSPIGFYHFIASDEKSITLQTWSTRTLNEFCPVQGQGHRYSIEEAGVWVDCLHQRKPVIHNDYVSLPHKKGMPEDHAKLIRELLVPIMRGGKILAILGVGNKPTDYTEKDVEIVSFMADVAWTLAEQKQADEALNISETRYRRLFEAAQEGTLILDAETGQISDVNPFLVEMLGYLHEDFLGKKLWEIGAFKDIEAAKAAFGELQAKGYVRYEDLPLETKDGRAIAVEFVSNVYLVNHHKVIQCNIRDITERKRIAEALQKAHNELEQRVEERTVDLRTALSEIKTMKDQLEAENIYFRQEIKMRHQFEHILGQSDGLKYILYRAEQVAPTDTTVLILGETGTGKELIAAAIHNLSPRKDRPLITVNCAALPANLMESELFGREKGAFTGADTRQVGRFEVANRSTLCLDEIGELPLEMQAKLLRAIQHKEFERLGSSQTIKVDVRIVATTNRDLEEEVRKGRFRQDLYYRLNVFPITVPPLRQRAEDIPLLVQAFVERYSRKLGKQITSIQKETMKALQDYPWPGNVRELESVIERALILCPGPVLQLADKLETSSLPFSSAVKTLEEMEQNQILKALSQTRWRIEGKDGAAAVLGLNPSTLRARMHKLGILRPETKGSD